MAGGQVPSGLFKLLISTINFLKRSPILNLCHFVSKYQFEVLGAFLSQYFCCRLELFGDHKKGWSIKVYKMLNFTSREKEDSVKLSVCLLSSAEESEDVKCKFNSHIFIYVNAILSITALPGNFIILVALCKESSLHPPSKLLLRWLSCTDLLVGMISQPIFIVYHKMIADKVGDVCEVTESLAYITSAVLCGQSINTMTLISTDRLFALLFRLRYRQIVTLKRVRSLIISSWIVNFTFALTYLWNKEFFFMGSCIWLWLFLSISSCCYLKIYFQIRRQQAQIQEHDSNSTASLNLARYKKTVLSALCIHLTLSVCYLPYTVTTTIISLEGISNCKAIIWNIAGVLVFLNSSLNPVLYFWTLREIRRTVMDIFRQFFSSS